MHTLRDALKEKVTGILSSLSSATTVRPNWRGSEEKGGGSNVFHRPQGKVTLDRLEASRGEAC